MTEDGRSTGMVALCGLSPSLIRVWDRKDARLDAITKSLGLGRSLALVVSHPKRDEAALRMGAPVLRLGAAFGFVLRTNEAQVSKARPGAPAPEMQILRCTQDDSDRLFQFRNFQGETL
jgi:hypothetical protein